MIESDTWFERVREAFSVGWVIAPPIERVIGSEPLTPLETEYGRRFGLLPAGPPINSQDASVMQINIERSTSQERSSARRLWIRYILLTLCDWWDRNGQPQLELQDVLSPWDAEGSLIWERLRPRGLDSLYFGNAARRRLVARIREWARSG